MLDVHTSSFLHVLLFRYAMFAKHLRRVAARLKKLAEHSDDVRAEVNETLRNHAGSLGFTPLPLTPGLMPAPMPVQPQSVSPWLTDVRYRTDRTQCAVVRDQAPLAPITSLVAVASGSSIGLAAYTGALCRGSRMGE